jgi:hypothetical protein
LIHQLHYLHNRSKNLSRFTTISFMDPKGLKFHSEIDEILYSDWNSENTQNSKSYN